MDGGKPVDGEPFTGPDPVDNRSKSTRFGSFRPSPLSPLIARAASASRARNESAKFRVRCAFRTRTEASGAVSRCGDPPTRGVDGYLQRGAIDGSLTEQQRPGDSRDGVELLCHRRRQAGPRALRVRIRQTEKQKTRFDPVGRHRAAVPPPAE